MDLITIKLEKLSLTPVESRRTGLPKKRKNIIQIRSPREKEYRFPSFNAKLRFRFSKENNKVLEN